MLKIYVDTTANYKPWSGAVSTYETIAEEDKLKGKFYSITDRWETADLIEKLIKEN